MLTFPKTLQLNETVLFHTILYNSEAYSMVLVLTRNWKRFVWIAAIGTKKPSSTQLENNYSAQN